MAMNIIDQLKNQIEALPVGYISKKTINGKVFHYRQWKENGKVKSQYIPNDQVDYVVHLIDERKRLQEQLQIETYRASADTDSKMATRIYEYGVRLHLKAHVPIGVQYYEELISHNLFYIDKTDFIRDWWYNTDPVTLITRPRRFGKTLNLSMINCFFSLSYANRSDLFDKFSVWRNWDIRKYQGTYPTIFISFGGVKEKTVQGQLDALKTQIYQLFSINSSIVMEKLTEFDRAEYQRFLYPSNYSDEMILNGINALCHFFYRAYNKKTIILIDEYDTPMLEAWTAGTWDQCADNMRLFFNKTLKTNPYIKKALLTGITRISKESFFSDMNNLMAYSMTSNMYADAFGFTEDEVELAMKHQGLDNFDEVKTWYDGFTIGDFTDIYNPWSMVNFLKLKEIKSYWVNSSSNALINTFLKEGNSTVKKSLEDLINGGFVLTTLEEETPFHLVAANPTALWSLLFHSGYLKIVAVKKGNPSDIFSARDSYALAATNYEVREMFINFIKGWFADSSDSAVYNEFIRSLLCDDIDGMQEYLESVIMSTFSYFDVSGNQPERFYHGFVLGMIVSLSNRFIITSNRESGYGRYDVMLVPKDSQQDHAIILEFKVFNPKREDNLTESAKKALQQINEKNYAADIIGQGISEDNIYKYGIAFSGKDVWIES